MIVANDDTPAPQTVDGVLGNRNVEEKDYSFSPGLVVPVFSLVMVW